MSKLSLWASQSPSSQSNIVMKQGLEFLFSTLQLFLTWGVFQILGFGAAVQFSSVQLLSCVWLFVTPWTAARQASLSVIKCQSPPKPMSIKSVMSSNHLILCHPLLLPSIFPSIRVFSNESALRIRWPQYWSFSFSISPSNEHSGLISFRMDWLDLLAVQGTLRSLLQHHSSKASILQSSAFFITLRLNCIHNYFFTWSSFKWITRQSSGCDSAFSLPKARGTKILQAAWHGQKLKKKKPANKVTLQKHCREWWQSCVILLYSLS